MQRYISLISLSFFLLLAGCGLKLTPEAEGGPFRVKLPILVDGEPKFRIVEISTIENRSQLKGQAARFYLNPQLKENGLSGARPHLKLHRTDEGYYVPQDAMTIQILSMYYQFEQLLFWDQELEISQYNHWPRPIAMNVNYQYQEDDVSEVKSATNNALYAGDLDALLLVPYHESGLPFSLNSGVLAHEHFHSIFQKMVINQIPNSKEIQGISLHPIESLKRILGLLNNTELENHSVEAISTQSEANEKIEKRRIAFLRGVNEGLADVWGWLFSKDPQFVERSLPSEKSSRKVDLPIGQLVSKSTFNISVDSVSKFESSAYSYQLGNQIARVAHRYSKFLMKSKNISEDEARITLQRQLIRNLKDLSGQFSPQNWDLAPVDLLPMLFKNSDQDWSPAECRLFKGMVSESDQPDEIAKKWNCKPEMESEIE